MGIGTSIFLIALGAIFEYALPHSVGGIHLGSIGVILMVVGVLGLAVTLLMTRPWESAATEPRRRVVEPEREVLVERPREPETEVIVERAAPAERRSQRPGRPW